MSHSASVVLGKRLRLGTKSCAECRRRKVRCIFKTGASVCDGCALHGVECHEQQGAPPKRPSALDGSRAGTTNNASTEALQNRIAHLENMMAEMLRGGRREDGVSSVAGSSTTRSSIFESERSNQEFEEEDWDADFENTPLSAVWKEAVPVVAASSEHVSVVGSRLPPLSTAPPTLPGPDGLARILNQSRTYWDCWPSCMFGAGQLKKLDSQQQEQGGNVALLQESINSGNYALVAKVYLWIALCLTHHPRDRVEELQLILPRRELLNRYAQYATLLLSSHGLSTPGLDDMECYSVLWKIHFDNGRPKEAWKTLRGAITLAIQLKLNQSSARKNVRKRHLWSTMWQNERQISCMLGLPSCTSNDHQGTQHNECSREDYIGTLHYKLSIINGEIIKRDQTELKENYATTIEIDQNLEKLRVLLHSMLRPAETELPFAAQYFRLTTAVRFWTVQKLIHMPYMMKTTESTIYQYSFDRAVEAARNIIDLLAKFRTAFNTYMCEVLDFQLFSSAIVLLLADHHRCHAAPHRNGDSEWRYISTALNCLKQTIQVLDCSVARQGAHALETLISAGQTACISPHQYFEVAIPYFGKIRLKYSEARPAPSFDTPESFEEMERSETRYNIDPSRPSIEFSGFNSNEGIPVEFGFGFGEELGVDWGSLFEGRLRGLEYEYNWVTEYPCKNYSEMAD